MFSSLCAKCGPFIHMHFQHCKIALVYGKRDCKQNVATKLYFFCSQTSLRKVARSGKPKTGHTKRKRSISERHFRFRVSSVSDLQYDRFLQFQPHMPRQMERAPVPRFSIPGSILHRTWGTTTRQPLHRRRWPSLPRQRRWLRPTVAMPKVIMIIMMALI